MNIVKQLRMEKHLKQKELAAALGICKDYVSLIERNKQTPGFKLAVKIANFFEVPVDSLNFFDNTQNKMFDEVS